MNEYEHLDDVALVRVFLNATSSLSDPEAAEAAGVTHTSIGRWKQGHGEGWKALQAGTRRKLLQYLERNSTTTNGAGADNAPPAADLPGGGQGIRAPHAKLDALSGGDIAPVRGWVGDMIQLVVSSDLNERWKVALAAEVAAAARGEAAVIEARAAERRAAAMERAEGSAEVRASSGQRAEEAAEARVWMAGLSPLAAEGDGQPVVPAVPPGEGRRLLQRFLEELQREETQNRKASGDPHT